MNAYSPKETIELCGRAGTAKANMRIDKMFLSSVMAGMLLAFACAVLLSTNTAPWFQDNAPGLIRTVAALVSCLMFFVFFGREGEGGVFPLYFGFVSLGNGGGGGMEKEGKGERGRKKKKKKKEEKEKEEELLLRDQSSLDPATD